MFTKRLVLKLERLFSSFEDYGKSLNRDRTIKCTCS